MLGCLVGDRPGKWDLSLSTVEFAYNSLVNRPTSKSLFEIVYGLNSRQPIDLVPYEKLYF